MEYEASDVGIVLRVLASVHDCVVDIGNDGGVCHVGHL